MEIVGYDGGYPLHYQDAFEGGASRICRHVDFVPEGIEVGLHLCYGDPGHKHIIEPKSLRSSVQFTNATVAGSKRRLNWVHMPVPRDRMDAPYYEPLRDLYPDRSAELYLGLVHQSGGLAERGAVSTWRNNFPPNSASQRNAVSDAGRPTAFQGFSIFTGRRPSRPRSRRSDRKRVGPRLRLRGR